MSTGLNLITRKTTKAHVYLENLENEDTVDRLAVFDSP